MYRNVTKRLPVSLFYVPKRKKAESKVTGTEQNSRTMTVFGDTTSALARHVKVLLGPDHEPQPQTPKNLEAFFFRGVGRS
jgi:hypothetical protein